MIDRDPDPPDQAGLFAAHQDSVRTPSTQVTECASNPGQFIDEVRLSARKGVLRVFGKGAKTREVPVHPALGALLQAWLGERAGRPGAYGERALILSRRGGRLTARAASDVFTAITAHVGRRTFLTRLIRGGEDLITVAELAGHARLETLKAYSHPTEEDEHSALRHLSVDR